MSAVLVRNNAIRLRAAGFISRTLKWSTGSKQHDAAVAVAQGRRELSRFPVQYHRPAAGMRRSSSRTSALSESIYKLEIVSQPWVI